MIREGALSTPTVQRQLLLAPFPHYVSAAHPGYSGSSRYHALAFRAEKRYGAGAVVSGHYTLSKNMTDVETLTDWLEGGSSAPVAGYQTSDLSGEWALSSFDVRHRVVVNFLVDLPFGEGRRFGADTTGIAGKLISGWSLNGVTTIQSGFPLSFTATPNLIGSGYGLRPNVDHSDDYAVPQTRKHASGIQEKLDRVEGERDKRQNTFWIGPHLGRRRQRHRGNEQDRDEHPQRYQDAHGIGQCSSELLPSQHPAMDRFDLR